MKESLQEATQRALIEGYKNLKENKPKKVEAKLADEIYTEDYDEKMESKQRDFKAEFLALPEKEQEKYKKCIPPLRRGLSNVEAETIAKERGLDAGILWWVTNIGQLTDFKESKKVTEDVDEDKVNLYDTVWDQISCYDEEYAQEQGIDKLDDEDVYNIIAEIMSRPDVQDIIREEIEDYAGRKNN